MDKNCNIRRQVGHIFMLFVKMKLSWVVVRLVLIGETKRKVVCSTYSYYLNIKEKELAGKLLKH